MSVFTADRPHHASRRPRVGQTSPGLAQGRALPGAVPLVRPPDKGVGSARSGRVLSRVHLSLS